jgi:hypothetical protein
MGQVETSPTHHYAANQDAQEYRRHSEDNMTNGPNPELLWRQYSLHTELYKFYIDAVIKINVFYYAVTGAILAFYLKSPSTPLLRFSLALPMALSFAIAVLFIYGAILNKHVRDEMISIRDALGLHTFPEVHLLSVLLLLFGTIFLGVGLALIWVMTCGHHFILQTTHWQSA